MTHRHVTIFAALRRTLIRMHRCPSCSCEDIHRSHTRTRWEKYRKEITRKRPFRCRRCGWRGWAVDLGPTFSRRMRAAARALATHPPNLAGLGFDRAEPRDVTLEN